jgi:hypothetical protein
MSDLDPAEVERQRQAAIQTTIEARRIAEDRMKTEAWLKAMHRTFKGIYHPRIRFHYLREASKKIEAERENA